MVFENSFLSCVWREAGQLGALQPFEWYTIPPGSSDNLIDLDQLIMWMFAQAERCRFHGCRISNQITALLRQVVACTLPVSYMYSQCPDVFALQLQTEACVGVVVMADFQSC